MSTPQQNRRWLIVGGLVVMAVIAAGVIVARTNFGPDAATSGQPADISSDTPYTFQYVNSRLPFRQVNRVLLLANVTVTLTPHADRPDSVTITPEKASSGSDATFTWTLIPFEGRGGPTRLIGEFAQQGTVYKACEAIMSNGLPTAYAPAYYAEQYYPIDNTGTRYHVPVPVDPAPFVAFMRQALTDAYAYAPGGGLPSHQSRAMAGDLLAQCGVQ